MIDVAVGDRHPDRAGAVLGLDGGVAAAYRRDRAGLHLGHRLAARERARADGCAWTVRHSGLLGQLLELRPCPLAVVALGQPALASPTRIRLCWARRSPRAVSRHRSSGLVTTAASGRAASRSPTRAACSAPVVVEVHARRAPGQHAGGVRRRSVRGAPRITVAMPATRYAEPAYRCSRDRRQRAVPRRRTGRRWTATSPTWPTSAARRPAPTTSSGSGCTSPTRTSSAEVADGFDLHALAVEDAVTRPPAAQAGALRRHAVHRAQDALVRRRGRRRRDRRDQPVRRRTTSSSPSGTARAARCRRPGSGSRSASNVLAHGPSAVVYAVCDQVVDGYEQVAEELAERRRRGRGVGVLRRAHQRLRADLHAQARARRGAPRGDAAAGADASSSPPAACPASTREAGPFFRDVGDHLNRVAETIDTLDVAAVDRVRRAPGADLGSSRTTTCARSPPGSASSPRRP